MIPVEFHFSNLPELSRELCPDLVTLGIKRGVLAVTGIHYRSGTVNSKSLVGKVLLRIK